VAGDGSIDMKTILLTPPQRAEIDRAAKCLPAHQRDQFLDRLAEKLGAGQPTNAVPQDAITATLATNRVFFTDSKHGANNKMKHHRTIDADDFEIINGKKCLKDGRTYRAGPVTLMDSAMQRDMRNFDRVTDLHDSKYGLHRPGFRQLSDSNTGSRLWLDARRKAIEAAYAVYDADLANSYKNPPTGADERQAIGQRAGDLCTVGGKPDVRTDAAPASAERLCPDCDGSGDIDGKECDTCGGTGMVDDDYVENAQDIVRNAATHTESARRRDHRTVAQMMRDHQNKMADIYNKLDYELSEKWRRS
jgi:hypothetical protein